jgi:brefeldin A-inhibited guanine nucleotide-exchange protein
VSKYTILSNTEVNNKNFEAIKVMLEIGQTQGNHLQNSWYDVIRCISQLEKFQLLSSGVNLEDDGGNNKRGLSHKKTGSANNPQITNVAEESNSQNMVIAIDKIFVSSPKLSGVII